MEPISAAATLGKILATGYSLYQAVQGKGTDFEKDLKAYDSLIELGGQLSGWLPRDSSSKDAGQALALLSMAFGRAFHECFGAFHLSDKKERLQANLTAAVEWALPNGSVDSKKPPQSLSELLSDPENTPYFAALWAAFTQRNLPGKAGYRDDALFAEPLIANASGEARSRFEQVFRRNVGELLASPAARDLGLAVLRGEGAAERARWVERLLVSDMATWHERHVFGNVKGHDTLPAMPLGKMYVEPRAMRRVENLRANEEKPTPIVATLRAALQAHSLVVVTADFGHGKSLTARTLAYQTAKAFLETGEKPSAELERPVFVKCQAAFGTSSIELAPAVRRAQWRTLTEELGIDELAESDEALNPPSKSQRTLFLLDGLDEVAFLERDCLHFFEKLRGQLNSKHRAIVFSRPHSLPTEKLAEWNVPVFELLPFDTTGEDLGQAGEWLARWNQCSGRPAIATSALRTEGLEELARTPILLFMMAYTWGDLKTLYAEWQAPETERESPPEQTALSWFEEQEATWDRKHRIYESFFRAIAWGKYERDGEGHPAIRDAAKRLREALEARSLIDSVALKPGSTQMDSERDYLTRSMLWLMGRVAWESRCLQQKAKPKSLTRSHVERLIGDELEIEDTKVTEVIRDGLLLAMQADLSESSRPILFGHQSFREFLVARCWSELLRVIVDPEAEPEQKEQLIKILRAGRLRDGDDRSFDFLRARLRQWSAAGKRRLHEWALEEFTNDRLESSPPTLQSDTRRDFRCTALALASVVAPSPGLKLSDHGPLRSLLAGYWIAGRACPLWVILLDAERIHSPGAQIPYANLSGANLDGANLSGATLSGANLSGATLDGANLDGANLDGANLYGAALYGATLYGATLYGATLDGATLYNATLDGANLDGANLDGANLSGANLSGVNLDGANLSGANLSGANLSGANLSGATLYGATLYGANLSRANLSRCLLDEDGYQIAVASGAVVDETTMVQRRPIDDSDGKQ